MSEMFESLVDEGLLVVAQFFVRRRPILCRRVAARVATACTSGG